MILPNPDEFIYRDCVIGGDECVLIFPSNIGATWTPDNLQFRSIIIRKSDHRVVSMGHRKWFNHTEKPHLYPDPVLYRDWVISTKLDGSLIIISRHKGELIVRTRGTINVDQHDTAAEIRDLIEHYHLDRCLLLEDHSLLLEHTTHSNQIVIRYDKPDLTLLDIVRHSDCSYLSVAEVDHIAGAFNVPRPARHQFNSIDDILAMLPVIKDIEGYVLAYNGNQNRVKMKGADYILRHRMKSEMSSLARVLDYYLTLKPLPSYDEFYSLVEKAFDHEIAETAAPHMSLVVAAAANALSQIVLIQMRADQLKNHSRKDAALLILSEFTAPGHSGIAFHRLNGKSADLKHLRMLMEKSLDIA